MSTKTNEEVVEKLGNLLSKTKQTEHLAKVTHQNPNSYSVNLTFLEPSDLAGISLKEVQILRTGAGRIPEVGETVVVGYIGQDLPYVKGSLREGSYSGILSGNEIVLGDHAKVAIDANGRLVLEGNGKTQKDILMRIYSMLEKLSQQPTSAPSSPLAPSLLPFLALLKADIESLYK